MGQYEDGKWVPTFGDAQFGQCLEEEYTAHRRVKQERLDQNNAGEISLPANIGE